MPGYRRMVKRFVAWVNTDPGARVLAIGPWAKRDFLKMGITPEKIVDWGYFVELSRFGTQVPAAHAELDETCVPTPLPTAGRHDCVSSSCDPRVLRVLWAGRDLDWKRVRDIERAVGLANTKIVVDDSCSCRKDDRKSNSALPLQLQTTTTPITFTKLTGVTPAEVRKSMREHDLYVLASNAEEGWGAALNEALEEEMSAIGTYEAGASAAMLPPDRLYHAGDVKALARLLEAEYRGELPACSIGEWTAKNAAERLVRMGESRCRVEV